MDAEAVGGFGVDVEFAAEVPAFLKRRWVLARPGDVGVA